MVTFHENPSFCSMKIDRRNVWETISNFTSKENENNMGKGTSLHEGSYINIAVCLEYSGYSMCWAKPQLSRHYYRSPGTSTIHPPLLLQQGSCPSLPLPLHWYSLAEYLYEIGLSLCFNFRVAASDQKKGNRLTFGWVCRLGKWMLDSTLYFVSAFWIPFQLNP